MRKFLLFVFVLVTADCVAQEKGEAADTVDVSEIMERPNLPQYDLKEMDCRKWARRFGDIYIVCGPVYLKREHETIGYNKVYVPEAFFKVVLCLNGTPKGFGFIVRNTDGNKKRDLYYNSIDQVERITGYDSFPALPDSIENEVEAKLDMNLWY